MEHSFNILTMQWEKEKAALQDLSKLKQKIEEVRLQIERAKQDYNLEEPARLEYGVLPDLEKKQYKTVLVDERQKNLIKFLENNKFEVITAKMRHMYTQGGGIHCATLDTVRDSKLESYFE